MKKYEYVNVHIGKLCGAKSEEHRTIIDQYAAKGYRYAGFIPTNMSDYGKIKDMDLVFEMDLEACNTVEHNVSKECQSTGLLRHMEHCLWE